MKPLWDELRELGIRIVTARHEVAAVHMAQAEADLRGRLAVAVITAGPGITNAVTGIACAYLARSPVLVISPRPPALQAGMGALEEIDQTAIVRPVCRTAEVIDHARHVDLRLERAVSAALGDDGPPGPAYVEFPCDLLQHSMEAGYGPHVVTARAQPRAPGTRSGRRRRGGRADPPKRASAGDLGTRWRRGPRRAHPVHVGHRGFVPRYAR